jgi:hypothetical protein
MKDFTRRHVGMKIAAPKYIQRYFPEHAHKWQDSLDFVDTAGNITSWYDCNKFFESIPCSESKYSCKHGETRSKFPYPWLGVSLSRHFGWRGMEISKEMSDSDVSTVFSYRED